MANAVLRYLLRDSIDMAKTVEELLVKNEVTLRYEVTAEIVYVLEKVYSLPRNKIRDGIKAFIEEPNVKTETVNVLLLALNTYADKKLDFVDCLLYGFNTKYSYGVFIFDKKLNVLMGK